MIKLKYILKQEIRESIGRESIIDENRKLAKQFVDQGKLSHGDFIKLTNIDPTNTKKYVGWLAKQWIANENGEFTFDQLRTTIEEFNAFLTRGKTKHKDIFQYSTFADLKLDVDYLNNSGEGVSVKNLESDYETIVDTNELLIMSPHTHEASRKLGLSHFAFRSCPTVGTKDSAWCVTYKAPDHFNSYYYNNNVTFYYVKVKSENLQSQLLKAGFSQAYFVIAIAVLSDSRRDAYDGNNDQIKEEHLDQILNIIGIS